MATYKYIRKSGDKAYRKVNITATGISKFEDFSVNEQLINYPDTAVVLEILREDGTTELYYDGSTTEQTYVAFGTDSFRLSVTVPTERIWLQKSDGTGIPYKVPATLKEEDGLVSLLVPGGTRGWELVGDKYFAQIIDLKIK